MMYGGKNANKGRNNRYVWVECCGPLHPDGPVRSRTRKYNSARQIMFIEVHRNIKLIEA